MEVIFCITFLEVKFLFYSYGYAFLVSSEIGGDVKKIFDSIEDIIAQADEVDEKYLQVQYMYS